MFAIPYPGSWDTVDSALCNVTNPRYHLVGAPSAVLASDRTLSILLPNVVNVGFGKLAGISGPRLFHQQVLSDLPAHYAADSGFDDYPGDYDAPWPRGVLAIDRVLARPGRV